MAIKPFPVPESVYLDMPPGRKQDGIRELPKVLLADLSDEQLVELCEEFTAAIFKGAGRELK